MKVSYEKADNPIIIIPIFISPNIQNKIREINFENVSKNMKNTSILYLAFESGASTIQLHSKVRPLYLMKLFRTSQSFVT